MAKSIKVKIGGRDYSLVGEDEGIILSAAEEVNSKIGELKSAGGNLPQGTLTVLAALNIAESRIRLTESAAAEHEYLADEIRSMTAFLSEVLRPVSPSVTGEAK